MRMLDAFCGTGGISDGAAAEGWEVVGIDVARDARYRHPIIHKDIREVSPAEVGPVDWFHASPPCQRFSHARASRKFDPATDEDLGLLRAALWLRDQLKPRVWSVENVLGAIPLFSKVLGPPRLRNGSFFLWGNFPGFLMPTSQPHRKGRQRITSGGTVAWDTFHRSAIMRARVPETLARGLARACAPIEVESNLERGD